MFNLSMPGFISLLFFEVPLFDANSAGPNHTPHSAASYLGLHSLSDIFGV